MFELIVEQGPHRGQTIHLDGSKLVLGRSVNSHVCLSKDPTVSRSHLEIGISGIQITVRDLGSTSGTFVNGVRLSVNSPTQIRAGDKLTTGETTMSLRSRGIAPPPIVDSSVRKPQSSNACQYCNSAFAILGSRARNTRFDGVCNTCAKPLAAAVDRFRVTLQSELTLWNGSPQNLNQRIDGHCQSLGIDRKLAIAASSDLAIPFLQRVVAFLLQDGHLSESEERTFYDYLATLGLDEGKVPNLMPQIRYYRLTRNLRAGQLPSIQPSIMLPAGEIAHCEVPVTYYRMLTSGTRLHNGILTVTSSRVILSRSDIPFEVSLSKVVGVNFSPPDHFELQLTRKQGTGMYASQNSITIVEILRAVLSHHHRHTVLNQASSRVIPQDIKSAVWARDGGRCTQCRESQYLEFDHIIPFSKGGATSVNNLQLLCRGCNLAKSNKL